MAIGRGGGAYRVSAIAMAATPLVCIAVELSLLYADGDTMMVLICGERDSRGRCSTRKMLVDVFVRNTSTPSDVENKLSSRHLGKCILPSDRERLAREYASALRNGTFCRLITTDPL